MRRVFRLLGLMVALLAAVTSLSLRAAVPAYVGPTPGTLRAISIPTVDLSRD